MVLQKRLGTFFSQILAKRGTGSTAYNWPFLFGVFCKEVTVIPHVSSNIDADKPWFNDFFKKKIVQGICFSKKPKTLQAWYKTPTHKTQIALKTKGSKVKYDVWFHSFISSKSTYSPLSFIVPEDLCCELLLLVVLL